MMANLLVASRPQALAPRLRFASIRRPAARFLPAPLRSWFSYRRSGGLSAIEYHQIRADMLRTIEPAALWQITKDPFAKREFAQRLRLAILRAGYLGLHRRAPMEIVDLGTGPGFFVAVAKYLGHRCIGYDLPLERLSSETAEAYQLFLSALRCTNDRHVLTVEAFRPLNLPEQVNLISAGLICFNERPSGELWSRAEWDFFLGDAASYLNPGGQIFLELNADPRFDDLRWYDGKTLSFFKSRCEVRGNKILYQRPA
jgi:hypothetical protein